MLSHGLYFLPLNSSVLFFDSIKPLLNRDNYVLMSKGGGKVIL